jgi:hypothetical protein|tara:strand:+ start:621 stop:1076 length:456 start_codon:yes stop_codon:yes gene_type:complete
MSEKRESHDEFILRNMRDSALKDRVNKASRMVWVTFEKEGLHKYPAALDDPKLATGDKYDVSFLGYIHRHIFKFRVWIEVFHDDRDIEFIQFKRWMNELYEGELNVDFQSCEMISDDLYLKIQERYPSRNVWIEVSEDGENGALTTYSKDV